MPAQAAVGAMGLNGWGYFGAMLLAGAIDAYIIGNLLGGDNSTDENTTGISTMVKSAVASQKIVYGRSMTSGVLIHASIYDRFNLNYSYVSLGDPATKTEYIKEVRDSGSTLYLGLVLAAHECDEVEQVYLGEDLVGQFNKVTGNFDIDSKYANYVRISAHLGEPGQTANSTLINVLQKHYLGHDLDNTNNTSYFSNRYGVSNITGTYTTSTPLVWNNVTKEFEYGAPGQTVTFDPANAETPIKKKGGPSGITIPAGTYPFFAVDGAQEGEPSTGPEWDSNYKLSGHTYILVELTFNPDLFNGIPNIKAVVRGKKLYDPRWDLTYYTGEVSKGLWAVSTSYSVGDWVTESGIDYICTRAHNSGSTLDFNGWLNYGQGAFWRKVHKPLDSTTWEWSDNWALVTRDYLTSGNFYDRGTPDSHNTLYGVGAEGFEIDELNIIESANISDEQIALQSPAADSITAVDHSSGVYSDISILGDKRLLYSKYTKVRVYAATLGYWTTVGYYTYYTGATLKRADLVVRDSVYNSGTNTTVITINKLFSDLDAVSDSIEPLQNRYTCNGVVDTKDTPVKIMSNINSAAQAITPFVQGVFRLQPAVYQVPTIPLNEDNLAGQVKVIASTARSDLFNTVKGTIINPANTWQSTDFTQISSSTFKTEDGGYELAKNISLPFTTHDYSAQRLAKMYLERARQAIRVELTCNLSVLELSIGSFIDLSLDRFGWTNKVFSVRNWSISGNTISLLLQEEVSTAYDWNYGELTTIDYATNTSLASRTYVPDITGLVVTSGTHTLLKNTDGSIVPRVRVLWDTPSADNLSITVEYSTPDPLGNYWSEDNINSININGTTNDVYISPLQEGDTIQVRVKAYNAFNSSENWAASTTHTVVGKSEVPNPCTGLTASTTKAGYVTLTITPPADIDLAGVQVWSNTIDVLGSATHIDTVLKGTNTIDIPQEPGTMYYWVLSIDTTNHLSATYYPAINGVVGISVEPPTSGTISGTVDFASVNGATKPADNATVGATWGSDISNEPTVLGDINTAEGNKLTGIADGADVTASNTAAAIAGQGALATKSQADYTTDISGTKPPTDADNTTAAINGNLTVTGTITGLSITAGTITSGTFNTNSGTGQRMIIDGTTNEMNFYGNTGSVVELAAQIGINTAGSDSVIGLFGTSTSTNTKIAVRARAYSLPAVYGDSYSGAGVQGRSLTGPGILGTTGGTGYAGEFQGGSVPTVSIDVDSPYTGTQAHLLLQPANVAPPVHVGVDGSLFMGLNERFFLHKNGSWDEISVCGTRQWSDVSASRSYATTYTNNGTTELIVAYTGNATVAGNGRITGYVDGVAIQATTIYTGAGHLYFHVPPGSTYKIENTVLTISEVYWYEYS